MICYGMTCETFPESSPALKCWVIFVKADLGEPKSCHLRPIDFVSGCLNFIRGNL